MRVHMAAVQPPGFFAAPPGGKGRGVLVLHAWWGLNQAIKDLCGRFANAGLTAFAPDLYHGKVAASIPEAEVLGKQVDENEAGTHAEIARAVGFLRERTGQADGVAVVAFSLGGYYALHQSAVDPERIRLVVLFYGAGGGIDFSRSKAAYLGHFAEHDQYESRAQVDQLEEALRRAGRPVTFHHYPGASHWFFEPDRKEAYNKPAADLAWDRTLEFLKRSAHQATD